MNIDLLLRILLGTRGVATQWHSTKADWHKTRDLQLQVQRIHE